GPVMYAHQAEEALKEQPSDRRDDAPELDLRALADAVDRARGNVPHARVPDVQVDEHVVGEAVAAVDPVEVEPLERLAVDRRVAGLRVGDVPVAGRDLGQHGQDGVAKVAVPGHEIPRLAGEEPGRLRVVEIATGDRTDRQSTRMTS